MLEVSPSSDAMHVKRSANLPTCPVLPVAGGAWLRVVVPAWSPVACEVDVLVVARGVLVAEGDVVLAAAGVDADDDDGIEVRTRSAAPDEDRRGVGERTRSAALELDVLVGGVADDRAGLVVPIVVLAVVLPP